jgi:ribosome assembly protein 1
MARADPSVEFYVTKKGEQILSTCGEVHLEKCLNDLRKDFAPDIKFEIGEQIIPFKETITNRSVRDKVRKAEAEYEELNSSSESEEELPNDGNEEAEEGQDQMTLAEFLEKQEELKDAREMLRKEQQMDMYIEKLFLAKLYRDDQVSLDKLGFKKNCAEDKTANQKCHIKVRAVGLHYSLITQWLEQP